MKKMKDSGIEWIGDIPKHWIITRLKYLISSPLQYGANETGVEYDEKLPRYIRITDITLDNQLKEENKLSLPYTIAQPYLLKNNDILFARSGATVGKSFIYKSKYGISAFAGYLIKASIKETVSPDFIYYYTLGSHYDLWKDRVFTQATIQNIGADKYNNLMVSLPPIEEQQAIASYLDEKCTQIDKITADIKKQIKLLEEYKKSVITETVTKGLNPHAKTKDSGIEWINKIPEHWEVKKLKYSCSTRSEKYTLFNGKLDYFALENIVSWDSKYIETENTYELDGANLCYKGDVVFGKLRPYLAKTFLVDYDRCCSSEFAVFCNFQGVSKYYLYVFTEQGFINTVDNSTYGVKMPRANIKFIENMFIPIPPVEEQQQIADYLDRKCTEIDNIISKKKQQIKNMEEYKKSLIFECVTGKRKV